MKLKNIISLTATFVFSSIVCTAQNPESEFESGTIHIGVVVSDLEKSLEFYKNIIGMEETGGFGLDATMGKKTGLTGGEPFDAKILQLKNGDQNTQWKLISFNKKGAQSKYIQDNTGMRYITIYVNSIKPVLTRLRENKIKLLGDTPIRLSNGKTFILIQDPDGIFIELIGGA